jgi:ankyrin repeat protein
MVSKNKKLRAGSFMDTDRLFLFCRAKPVLILILIFGFTAFAQSDNSISSDHLKELFAEQDYEKFEKIVTKENVNSLFIEGESLLTKAIEKKDRRLFDMLLAKGIDVNLTNNDFYGSTQLMACSGYENLEFAKLLLEKGADVNQIDKSGDPVIHWSSYSGQVAFTELFLDHGARISIKSKHANGALEIALKEYQNSITDLLIYRGKTAVKINPEARKLAYDIKSNNIERLRSSSGKFNVNQTDEAGTPFLILAAERGLIEIVKLLIENGADINAMNIVGHTALNRAVFFGKEDVVDLLLSKKADVNKTDERFILTPLMAAARKNRSLIGKKLIESGADINKANGIDNFTPLLWAVYSDNFEFVKMLLEYKPDLSVISKYDTDVFKVAKGKTKTILEDHKKKEE